jgi:rubrerythrin
MTATKAELEALKLAIETEQKGYDFFKKARDMAKTEVTRDLFDTLAKDELLHMKVIEDYYSRLTGEGTRHTVEEVRDELSKSLDSFKTIFTEAAANPEKVLKDLSDDIPNVQLAIDFERNGQHMYEKLAAEVDDPTAKEFYRFLEAMEEEHEVALDETMRYLQDPGNYMINAESWTME